MILGKITFRVEGSGGPRWFFCRPVANDIETMNTIVGICHVVFVEKVPLSMEYHIGDEITTYAVFDKILTQEQFNAGYCRIKITPITEEAYQALQLSKDGRRADHVFMVHN